MSLPSLVGPTDLAELIALVVLAGSTTATDDAPELMPVLEVPDGLEVTLWAESPQLYNPTAMDVDEHGRLWVTEAVNYRTWDGRNPGRRHAAGDRVVVLQDTDLDGRADSSHVFVQDTDLVAPLGILVLDDRVLVSSSPNLFAYFDDDGDDVADRRETLLTGFGGFDHDHGLHSFVFGPDGRLHTALGNAGPHQVTDADGWTLRSGSFYKGGGPTPADNVPGLLSDDGRAWTGGLVLAMDTDGGELAVVAHNFRNIYEVAVDSFGDRYTFDNDDDGNQGCRASWVMEGGNYGFFSTDGARSWQADRRPGQPTPRAHWHADDPGVTPTGAITGAGGPTGMCAYESGLMPSLTGTLLGADAGRNRVWIFRPRAEGSGIVVDLDVLVRSVPQGDDDELAHLFRPSDVTVGIDGAVYVADWFDPGVGGHQAADGLAYGRILRIAPEGQAPSVPALDLTTQEGVLDVLASPAPSIRARGFAAVVRALAEEPSSPLTAEQARAVSAQLVASRDPILRARGFWLAARAADQPARELMAPFVLEQDSRLKLAWLRAMRAAGIDLSDILRALSLSDDVALRREVAHIAATLPADDPIRWDVLVQLARSHPLGDRFHLEALGTLAEGSEERLLAELLAAVDDGDEAAYATLPAPLVEIAWRLHPPSAVDLWVARARAEHLPPDARVEALSALAFTPGREAAEAMLTLALAGDDVLAEHATFWIQHRDGNDWRSYDLARHLMGAMTAEDQRFRSDVIRAGCVEVDVDVSGSSRLLLEATDGGNGNACDWVDWLEPRWQLADGSERPLGDTPWLSAEAGWGAVHRGADCVGGELDVGGEVHLDGIGTHAPSRILFEVPPDAVRFAARACLDDDGTEQQGCPSSVAIVVWADRPASLDALLAEKALVANAAADDDAREEAAEALALDAEGGAWLVARAGRGELDEALHAIVGETIWRNPDLGVRALASEHFARPDAGEHVLPPVSELLAMPGSARRGRAVFTGSDSACGTCHVFDGRGGDVGPDLTAIREKYGRAELLDALLNPAAGVAFGYDGWAIETTQGRVLTGFVLAEGERVVLKDSRGERHVLPAEEIADRWKLTRSLMPDNAALGLSAQQLADLATFLLEDRSAPPPLGEPIDLLTGLGSGAVVDGEPPPGWVAVLPGADAATARGVFTLTDGLLSVTGRPIGYLRTEDVFESFVLELEWRTPPGGDPGNSGVLLRVVGEDVVWPKSLEAQLHSENAGDIWNIGEFGALLDATRTSGRRTVKRLPSNEVPLGDWNRYRITLDGPELLLEVNGEVQNGARWCDEVAGHVALQSEGAPIQFRRIVLTPIER